MIDKGIPEINVDEIMQKIREEVARRKTAWHRFDEQDKKIYQVYENEIVYPKMQETKLWRIIKKIQHKLQKYPFYSYAYRISSKFKKFIPKYQQHIPIEEFLKYHDEEFIENAYKGILKREPDPKGFSQYLSTLRSGRLSKGEILSRIRYSKEGREKHVYVKGLFLRFLISRCYQIPILGYILRLAVATIRLPKILIGIQEYQAFTNARLAGKADREAVEELRPILAGKADREAVEELGPILAGMKATTQDILRQISDHRLNILDQQRRILLLLEEVRRRFPEPLSHEQIKSVLKEEDHILDAMYMVFEDQFRGTRAEIKRRLSVYLSHIDKIKSEQGDVSILDVGCGRGEWLELLQENGYRAKGIDINRVALLQCGEYGLDVTESDVIEYLKGLKRGSLDIITGFQILEHLPFKTLIALFDEALVVLKSGGMIIFETPNPANILVSSYDFYRDPSHQKPLHPDTMNFIAESRGFVRTGSYFGLDEGSDLKLIKSTEWMLSDINDYIKAPRDFALIGYKP